MSGSYGEILRQNFSVVIEKTIRELNSTVYMQTMDLINRRMGKESIKIASEGFKRSKKTKVQAIQRIGMSCSKSIERTQNRTAELLSLNSKSGSIDCVNNY